MLLRRKMAATTNSQLLILAVMTPATTMATWRQQRERVRRARVLMHFCNK